MKEQFSVIIFTLFYVLGIISFLSNLTLQFAFIMLFCAVYFLFFKKIVSSKLIFLLLFAFLFGVFNTSLNIKYDDNTVSYSNNDISAKVKVLTIPTNSAKDRTKFYAKVISAKFQEKKIDITNSKVLLTINDKSEKIKNIKIGDEMVAKGRLKVPQYAQNPSQFDYSRYLQYKKTFSILYVNDNWAITSRANDFLGKILSKLNDTREKIIKIHAQNIKSPMLEILGGVIFGDDAVDPDEDTKTIFVNSGIFHILAASGMNVTLIFGIWFFFAKRLKFSYELSIITGILLILFYTFMTGFGPPIIRATLMLIFILFGKLINRKTKTMALLFIVGFLMLVYNPLMLFDVGFQMSFIVTFALILTTPAISFNFKNNWLNNAIGACFIPIIAQIYAAPLQLFYFNTFTLYSVLANIAIIPVLSTVSFLGFISSMIALIPSIAQKVCFLADLILNPLLAYIVQTAEFFSTLPDSIIFLKKPPIFQILLYYSIIILFTCIIRYKILNKRINACLITLLSVFILSFVHIPDTNPEIIYFSVGNADSCLIKSPNGDYFMIDTGKTGYKGSSTPAKNIMVKYMRDKGINTLNSLILSHFDSDHAGGSVDIMDNIKVKKLYITDVYENTTLSDNIKNYVKEHNINEEIIDNTKEIYNKNGFVITLLKPKGNLIKNENQKSLIVHVKYKNQSFLFMGDGDINSYNALEEKFKNNINIIKSGHHGAKDTVNDEIAKNCDLFILSTGENIYNHPHPTTTAIITKHQKSYLRTDKSNSIKAVLMPNKVKIFKFSPKKRKYL